MRIKTYEEAVEAIARGQTVEWSDQGWRTSMDKRDEDIVVCGLCEEYPCSCLPDHWNKEVNYGNRTRFDV